jgi:hypothetical protein
VSSMCGWLERVGNEVKWRWQVVKVQRRHSTYVFHSSNFTSVCLSQAHSLTQSLFISLSLSVYLYIFLSAVRCLSWPVPARVCSLPTPPTPSRSCRNWRSANWRRSARMWCARCAERSRYVRNEYRGVSVRLRERIMLLEV